jgi:small neutral amino acid transporter SnatA (MarC family)
VSGWFVLLLLLAAINPPRLRSHLDVRARPWPSLAAALTVFGAGAILVGFADGVLEALAITDETWHIGAGVVGLLVGARVLVAPGLGDIEAPDGWPAALVPFAFPLLFTPQLVVMTILLGATESKPVAVAWLAASLALTVAADAMPNRQRRAWEAAARFLGALLVILSVALVVAGIRDV